MFTRTHSPVAGCWLARLLLVLVVAAPPAALGLPWVIRVWQSDEGLPDNTVVGIAQTPDGFLWVATPAGLVRFDGVQFRQFTPVTVAGTQTSVLQAMISDHRGRLWIAKERGTVVCVDQGRTTAVFTPEKGPLNPEVRMLVEDSAGAVWVSYAATMRSVDGSDRRPMAAYVGGKVVRLQDGQARIFTAADGLPGGGTCQLAIDQAGQLWFSQGQWVGVFREGKFRPLAELTVQCITGARSGGIWACVGKQVIKYTEDGTAVQVGALPEEMPNVNPSVLYENRKGDLWIGTTEAGLFRSDSRVLGFTKVTSDQEILSIKEDRDGIMWVGTRGAGLNQVKGRVVQLSAFGATPPFMAVRSVCYDAVGLIWMVAQNGVVFNTGPGGGILSADKGWSLSDAQCVAADSQGGVWIGTQKHGLHHWRNGTVRTNLCTTNGLAGDSVNALLATPSGEVWIGTGSNDRQQYALQRWQGEQLRTCDLPSGSGPITALAVDSAGDCWGATADGLLLRVHQDVLTDETTNALAEPHAIRALLASPDGTLWIGYGGQGLGRLKAGRFTQYRMDQGLPDDYISSILADRRGRLWLASNRGIFSVLEQDLDDLAAGRSARLRSVAYGRNDGLSRLQASYGSWPGAVSATSAHRLCFAMQSGLAIVYAHEMEENKEPPTVVLDQVNVNGQTVAAYQSGEHLVGTHSPAPLDLRPDGARLRLLPGARQVEFVFTGLSFKRPENIGFKYRLHGLDKDWIEADTRRSAAYPRIPPGDYRFQVIACNSDGVWNETGAALALTILPHFWQTWWFLGMSLAGLVAGVAGVTWLVVWRRNRRRIERLEHLHALERDRARIARDIHDELGANLTRIAWLSELTDTDKTLPDKVEVHARKIGGYARQMVRSLDEIVWAVNPRNDTLQSLAQYLTHLAHEYFGPTPVNYRLDIPSDLPAVALSSEIRHDLCLATKEALHNTLKHAAASAACIHLSVADRLLTLVFEDNGRGFDPAALPPGRSGHGLANLRQRLENLGGRFQCASAPGHGTRLTFTLILPDPA